MLLLLFFIFSCALIPVKSASLGIINGADADIADYPWMVALYWPNEFHEDEFICGGSLISSEWVLTAANCLYYPITKIRANSTNLKDDVGIFVDVDKIYRHPNFTVKPDQSPINDIALVRLTSPVKGTNVGSINLPKPNTIIPEGSSISIAGWGDTQGNYSFSDVLQVIDLEITKLDLCAENYQNYNYTLDKEKEFCVGTIGKIEGPCSGDGGGVAQINGTAYGIVSWSLKGCHIQKLPEVLVNVPKYRSWIKDVTGL